MYFFFHAKNKKKLCSVIWKIVISLVYFVLSICVVDWLFSQNVYFNKNRFYFNLFKLLQFFLKLIYY